MAGEPSGKWDAATQDALRRYQTDQGWQAKTVPDSRALIKLGLGPRTDGLLNPESAMTAGPLASDSKAGAKQPATPPGNPAGGVAEANKPQRGRVPSSSDSTPSWAAALSRIFSPVE